MTKLPITYYGTASLQEPSKNLPVVAGEKASPELLQLFDDMIETMRATNGIGLAAPQVGKQLRSFIVLQFKGEKDGYYQYGEPRVFVNPDLSYFSKETDLHYEGCLSIPELSILVERPIALTIEALELKNGTFTPIKESVEGFFARMLMHEYDHLDGVLIIDRMHPTMPRKEQIHVKKALKEIARTRGSK